MKNVILFVISFIFSTISFADKNLSDPCEEIVGNWFGNLKTTRCQWEVSANGTKYNENIRLQMKLTKGRCYEENLVLNGTCVDSKLNLKDAAGTYKLSGTIYSGFIFLNDGPYVVLELNKNMQAGSARN